MMIDRAAGFGILALGLATALSLAPAAVVKAQVILQQDSLQSGATTPEKLNAQIREGAKTQQARGTAAARYGVYTISWPKDAAERDQLASYAAVGRPGEVRLDFAINRVGFVLIHLPTTAQDLGYKLEDPTPGAQPNNAVLRDMIKREFPGFPLPKL